MPGLQELKLQWPGFKDPSVPLTSLDRKAYNRCMAAKWLGAVQHGEGGPVHVEAVQLLPVVQSAPKLQSLDLCMELDPSSRDQLVLGLQGALPGLRRLGTLDGEAGLAPATLAALRPGLVHDLVPAHWRGDTS
jgi:hypothetical protein